MVTVQQLKNETVACLENAGGAEADDMFIELVESTIDTFLNVLEAHDGTIAFSQPERGKPRAVLVSTAGEKSGAGVR